MRIKIGYNVWGICGQQYVNACKSVNSSYVFVLFLMGYNTANMILAYFLLILLYKTEEEEEEEPVSFSIFDTDIHMYK